MSSPSPPHDTTGTKSSTVKSTFSVVMPTSLPVAFLMALFKCTPNTVLHGLDFCAGSLILCGLSSMSSPWIIRSSVIYFGDLLAIQLLPWSVFDLIATLLSMMFFHGLLCWMSTHLLGGSTTTSLRRYGSAPSIWTDVLFFFLLDFWTCWVALLPLSCFLVLRTLVVLVLCASNLTGCVVVHACFWLGPAVLLCTSYTSSWSCDEGLSVCTDSCSMWLVRQPKKKVKYVCLCACFCLGGTFQKFSGISMRFFYRIKAWGCVAFACFDLAWRIIPFSKWLVTPIYNRFRPSFGRGITPTRGLTNHIAMVINHLLNGIILQVENAVYVNETSKLFGFWGRFPKKLWLVNRSTYPRLRYSLPRNKVALRAN